MGTFDTGKLATPKYTVTAGFNYDCTPENEDGTRVEPGLLTVKLPDAVFQKLFSKGVIVEVAEVKE